MEKHTIYGIDLLHKLMDIWGLSYDTAYTILEEHSISMTSTRELDEKGIYLVCKYMLTAHLRHQDTYYTRQVDDAHISPSRYRRLRRKVDKRIQLRMFKMMKVAQYQENSQR